MSEPVKWTLEIKKKGTEISYRVSNGQASFAVAELAICFRAEDVTPGCTVAVEIHPKSGQPARVTVPGKTPTQPASPTPPAPRGPARHSMGSGGRGGKQSRPGWQGGEGGQRQTQEPRRDATAPYNFVTAESPLAFTDDDRELRYSGEIACSAEALTPLLIASNQRRDATDKPSIQERSFFTVGGRPVIPGASLKGMLRASVEALSRAPMKTFVGKTTIGTRDLSERKSAYSIRFQTAIEEGRLRAGFLERRGADVSIVPCDFVSVTPSALGLKPQSNASALQAAAEAQRRCGDLRVHFAVRHDLGGAPIAADTRFPTGSALQSGMREGRLVTTGGMPLPDRRIKDKGYIFYDPSPALRLCVDDEVTKAFEDQRTRSQDELLAFYRKFDLAVPVFYLVENGKVAAFGLCRFFRVATKHEPSALASSLPESVDRWPMSDLLFGAAGQIPRRGRVRCSMGTLRENTGTVRFPEAGGLVVGNPAASAITMYLVQDSKATHQDANRRNRLLATYDDDCPVLRGRKLYWHRPDPRAPMPPNDNVNVQAVYRPLKPGATFTFVVSFERLTLQQLGALCEAIDYPDGHAHKLGLGKPFGLGSVRLNVIWSRTSIRTDRERYASLARRLNDLVGQPDAHGTEAASDVARIATQAKEAFRRAVFEADGSRRDGAFEDLPHIRQLRILTNWKDPPPGEQIQYMPLNSKNRDVPTYALKPILADPERIAARRGC